MKEEITTVGAHLAELGADLTTIEINTIVKSKITGSKMPQTEHALMDVAYEMWTFLCEEKIVDRETVDWDEVHAGWGGWDACRKLAKKWMDSHSSIADPLEIPKHHERSGKLQRIVNACDQLKGILYDTSSDHNAMAGGKKSLCSGDACRIKRVQGSGAVRHTHDNVEVKYFPEGKGQVDWIPMEPRQMGILRKIWEVGLEDIAMQTTIQLDGDIVTRIHPRYITDPELQRIHHEGVLTSQTLWKQLIDIAMNLLKTVTDALKR